MRALIRRSLRHVNLVATLFLVLAGTSFAIAQESVDPPGPAAEETAGPGEGDGGADTGDDGSDQGDGEGEDGSDQGDSDQDSDGDGGEGSGSDGAEAQPGPLGVTVREGDEVRTDLDTLEVQATARCEEGEALTGGGVRTTDPTRGAKPIVQASHPSADDPNEWQATVLNSTGNGHLTAVAYAICAAQQP